MRLPATRLAAARVPQFFYNDIYDVKLPKTNSFPMEKYRIVRQALQRELRGSATFIESPLATLQDLCAVHDADYVRRFLDNELSTLENRRIGFPWSVESVDRSLSSTGGTVAATHAVCGEDGPRYAGHIAGGTHHAYGGHGEGYCVFNDIAVAAAVALRDYPRRVRRVLITDLDVHQGNGSAHIWAGDDRVTTYSQHCSGNIFSRREVSDLDVEVRPGAGDAEYLEALEAHLPALWEQVQPDLCFFQAGVDVHGMWRMFEDGALSMVPLMCERYR